MCRFDDEGKRPFVVAVGVLAMFFVMGASDFACRALPSANDEREVGVDVTRQAECIDAAHTRAEADACRAAVRSERAFDDAGAFTHRVRARDAGRRAATDASGDASGDAAGDAS